MPATAPRHQPPVLGPTLETARLILRPPTLEDFEPWADMMRDPAVSRFIGGVQSRPVAWRAFTHVIGSWALQGYHVWSVIEKDTGLWVGRVGPHYPEGWPGTEIGWSLVTAVQGKGYGFEAATAAIDWAVDQLGWEEIIHCIDAANAPSLALARRLGARWLRVAQTPPPYEGSVDIWGQSAAEWKTRRR